MQYAVRQIANVPVDPGIIAVVVTAWKLINAEQKLHDQVTDLQRASPGDSGRHMRDVQRRRNLAIDG